MLIFSYDHNFSFTWKLNSFSYEWLSTRPHYAWLADYETIGALTPSGMSTLTKVIGNSWIIVSIRVTRHLSLPETRQKSIDNRDDSCWVRVGEHLLRYWHWPRCINTHGMKMKINALPICVTVILTIYYLFIFCDRNAGKILDEFLW